MALANLAGAEMVEAAYVPTIRITTRVTIWVRITIRIPVRAEMRIRTRVKPVGVHVGGKIEEGTCTMVYTNHAAAREALTVPLEEMVLYEMDIAPHRPADGPSTV